MKSFITHLGSEHNLPIKGKMLSIGVVTLFGFLGVGVSSQRPPGRKLLVAPGQAGAALWPFLWSSGTPVSLGGGRWRKEKRRGGAIWTFQKTNLPPFKKKKNQPTTSIQGTKVSRNPPRGLRGLLGSLVVFLAVVCLFHLASTKWKIWSHWVMKDLCVFPPHFPSNPSERAD